VVIDKAEIKEQELTTTVESNSPMEIEEKFPIKENHVKTAPEVVINKKPVFDNDEV
jgi:hypothetical protein